MFSLLLFVNVLLLSLKSIHELTAKKASSKAYVPASIRSKIISFCKIFTTFVVKLKAHLHLTADKRIRTKRKLN